MPILCVLKIKIVLEGHDCGTAMKTKGKPFVCPDKTSIVAEHLKKYTPSSKLRTTSYTLLKFDNQQF